jgi:hypothetical protein
MCIAIKYKSKSARNNFRICDLKFREVLKEKKHIGSKQIAASKRSA